MFVDIHTHSAVTRDYPAIRNLTFQQAYSLFASDQPGIFSVGFHPWHADEYSTELMDQLITWTSDGRFAAIGECGLDKNSLVPFDVQLTVFKQQIELSEKAGLPLMIHCVGSYNELFAIKKTLNPHQPWIIHGFRGKPELAKQALKADCALSFGEHFNPESVRITPPARLFIETDESVMPLSEIYQSIAVIKNCRIDELNAGEKLLNQFM